MQRGWYYGWNVVAATIVFQAVSIGILIYSFALFVVPWLEAFDASRGEVMVAIAALQVGTGAMSPFGGWAMDRFAMRVLVLGGAATMALGLAATAAAAELWQVILVYTLVMPIGMMFCGPLAAQTLVSRWFRERRGLALGISTTGTSVGGFTIPFVVTALQGALGWRGALYALAAMSVVLIAPLAAVVLRRAPPEPESHAPDSPEAARATADAREWATGEILRSPMFWIPVIALVPINAAFGGVQFNLGAYAEDLGHGPQRAAALISLVSLAMIAGKFLFGSLADWVDHRRLYWGAAASLAASLVAMYGAPSYARLALGAALLGLAAGSILPMMAVVLGSRFGVVSFGRVVGLATLFVTLGAFGPLLAGWLRDVTGTYDDAFVAFLALLLPAAVVMTWLPRRGAELEPARTRAPRAHDAHRGDARSGDA